MRKTPIPLVIVSMLAGPGLALLGCATAVPTQAATTAREDPTTRPRIAIVSAFAPELEALLRHMKVESTEAIYGRTFHLGKLGGKDTVIFLSGVSTVNAAMTVQMALDHFKITRIVVSGIAGGVNPSLHIGDVTVPGQWAHYQEQTFAREVGPGKFAMESWQTKELGSYGMMFPQYTRVVRVGGESDHAESKFWFDVDPAMLKVATAVAASVELKKCTSAAVCLHDAPAVKVGGRGVSGSTFVNNADYRAWVWTNFQDGRGGGVDALDMESASIAIVAYANNVPFIAFRSLSDLAGGGSSSENEIETFFSLAADNSAALVERFVGAL